MFEQKGQTEDASFGYAGKGMHVIKPKAEKCTAEQCHQAVKRL